MGSCRRCGGRAFTWWHVLSSLVGAAGGRMWLLMVFKAVEDEEPGPSRFKRRGRHRDRRSGTTPHREGTRLAQSCRDQNASSDGLSESVETPIRRTTYRAQPSPWIAAQPPDCHVTTSSAVLNKSWSTHFCVSPRYEATGNHADGSTGQQVSAHSQVRVGGARRSPIPPGGAHTPNRPDGGRSRGGSTWLNATTGPSGTRSRCRSSAEKRSSSDMTLSWNTGERTGRQ